jgi:sugar phosphate isomerase/epimerase
MATKSNGPLMEDYIRALKAAKRMGAKAVVVHTGKSAIVIPLDGDYLGKLAPGQPPAPNADEERRKLDLVL